MKGLVHSADVDDVDDVVRDAGGVLESSDVEELAPPQKKPFEKRFSWIIPLVAMIPFLVNFLPEVIEKLPQYAGQYFFKLVESEFSRFEMVMAVAAARDIEPGQELTMSDLKTVIVERGTLPENAVSPMHVDQLIGRILIRPISKGQIIVLEGMPDNE